MGGIRDLLNDLAEFEKTPQAVGIELRLSLADIILRGLARKNWTQEQLAQASGVKASYLTRVIHSAQNCTFDSAGRILHALDVRPVLPAQTPVAPRKPALAIRPKNRTHTKAR